MKISKEKYYQLVGLLALGKIYNEKLQDIEKAVMSITKEKETCGHSGDAVYGYRTADELLKLLNISVSGGAK